MYRGTGVQFSPPPLKTPLARNRKRRFFVAQFKAFADFLAGLKSAEGRGGLLLEQAMVLYEAGMGDANSQSNHNLPVLLAEGGFKHGQHLAVDTQRGRYYPLPNLYVSMLQRLAIETESFASSTGTIRGLEMA